jgi:hypothetical protein
MQLGTFAPRFPLDLDDSPLILRDICLRAVTPTSAEDDAKGEKVFAQNSPTGERVLAQAPELIQRIPVVVGGR